MDRHSETDQESKVGEEEKGEAVQRCSFPVPEEAGGLQEGKDGKGLDAKRAEKADAFVSQE